MTYFSLGARGWTPVAYADGSTMADNAHHTLDVSGGGRVVKIKEVFIGGEATSSTVNQMAIRRHSTNAAGGAVAATRLNTLSVAANADIQGFVAPSATDPILASPGPTYVALINLSFNAFGGLVRWLAAPGEQLVMVGASAPDSQVSLSSVSGTGIISDHFIVEQL